VGFGAQVAEGEVGRAPHARRGREEGGRARLGGGYARTAKLTAGARDAEREKKSGAGARKARLTGRAHEQRESEGASARAGGSADRWDRATRESEGASAETAAAPTGGPARAEREGAGGRARARARGLGLVGRKAEQAEVTGCFLFSFYFVISFLFSFYFLHLIQIQMIHKFKLDLLRIMHQTKVKSRVQHDATVHTPLGFNLSHYYYK
jgi:hypothetical protein